MEASEAVRSARGTPSSAAWRRFSSIIARRIPRRLYALRTVAAVNIDTGTLAAPRFTNSRNAPKVPTGNAPAPPTPSGESKYAAVTTRSSDPKIFSCASIAFSESWGWLKPMLTAWAHCAPRLLSLVVNWVIVTPSGFEGSMVELIALLYGEMTWKSHFRGEDDSKQEVSTLRDLASAP